MVSMKMLNCCGVLLVGCEGLRRDWLDRYRRIIYMRDELDSRRNADREVRNLARLGCTGVDPRLMFRAFSSAMIVLRLGSFLSPFSILLIAA